MAGPVPQELELLSQLQWVFLSTKHFSGESAYCCCDSTFARTSLAKSKQMNIQNRWRWCFVANVLST